LWTDADLPVLLTDHHIFDLPRIESAASNDKSTNLFCARFVHRNQSDSWRRVRRKQSCVLPLCPVRSIHGVLLQFAKADKIVGGGRTNQHKCSMLRRGKDLRIRAANVVDVNGCWIGGFSRQQLAQADAANPVGVHGGNQPGIVISCV